ncbi:right-handed parallel beta-helix repeat-containing protein [Sorangium sp. So ce726]|uniref:right-handed parallel beta-helix repeat-containing protein n=1 Tax=Sorangium sp. So ce726 TaxID=3133319 RepID=UPI003F62E038
MQPLSSSLRDRRRSRSALAGLALALVIAGCRADESAPGAELTALEPEACRPGEMPLPGGGCQPAGLPPGVTAGLPPDMQCPPGETPLDDSACQPAGVPPDACGRGFEPDGRGGCEPILPEGRCPTGQTAVPGDTECHDVAPCGNGDYGAIPVNPMTQFVNGSYPGTDSDGTMARPWKRIQEGVDHALPGAIVAVAAGRYVENVLILGKPVRLWGRCPALVYVVGIGAATATIDILRGDASRSEVHGLAITGPAVGIGASGASELLIDRVWVYVPTGWGLGADDLLGPTSLRMNASLIEGASEFGVFIWGADVTIEATVVRDTQPHSNGMGGFGVRVAEGRDTHRRGTLSLDTSLLDQNLGVGLDVVGSDARVESTVVRDTRPYGDGNSGLGIQVSAAGEREANRGATLRLRASLLERNHDAGLLVVGSDATVESTVVRTTQSRSHGMTGKGIQVQDDDARHERGTLLLRASLVEDNHFTGVFVQRSDATIEATIVRDTQPTGDGVNGSGVAVSGNGTTHERGSLSLRASLIERNHQAGVYVRASEATIEGTVVRGTQPNSHGTGGEGVEIIGTEGAAGHAKLSLRSSLVERNHEAGVLIQASEATIEGIVVRGTQPNSEGYGGMGMVVQDEGVTITGIPTARERARLALRAALVEQNRNTGLVVVGSDATIESTVVRDTRSGSDRTGGVGISVEANFATQEHGALTLRSSLLEENREAGVLVLASDATIASTVVRDTRTDGDGKRGDGIVVTSHGEPTSATIAWTRVEGNGRAGISNFSAAVTLVSSTVQCNRIDLNGEDEVKAQPFTFDCTRGNVFGCEAPDTVCSVLSADLSPPEPIAPIRSGR